MVTMGTLKSTAEQAKTKSEIKALSDAQCEFIEFGKTDIVCPRCGSVLAYDYGAWGEATWCENPDCGINIVARGI